MIVGWQEREADPADMTRRSPTRPKAPPAAALSTILLAENEADFDATARILREAGFAVLHATTIVDALDVLRGTRRIDLLLAAVRIPGQPSGFTLARMARLRRAGLPILYFGEGGDILDKEAARALGPILRRPFTPDMLVTTVRSALPAGPGESTDQGG